MRFFILALPRSRTAWLANALTFGSSFCFHEGLADVSNLTELAQKMNLPYESVGNSDTCNLLVQRQLRAEFPHARFMVVSRNYDDALASCERQGLSTKEFEKLRAAHSAATRWCDCVVDFEHLDDELPFIAEYLTGQKMSAERMDLIRGMNVQRILDGLVVRPQAVNFLRSVA